MLSPADYKDLTVLCCSIHFALFILSIILPEDVIEDFLSELTALIIALLLFFWNAGAALLEFDKSVCLLVLKHWPTVLTIILCVLMLKSVKVCDIAISVLRTG